MSAARKLHLHLTDNATKLHLRLVDEDDPQFKDGNGPPDDPLILALCFLVACGNPAEEAEDLTRQLLRVWRADPNKVAEFDALLPVMRQALAELQAEGSWRTP
jgi:hypothetical protein